MLSLLMSPVARIGPKFKVFVGAAAIVVVPALARKNCGPSPIIVGAGGQRDDGDGEGAVGIRWTIGQGKL